MKSIRFIIALATFMVPIFATTVVSQTIDSCAIEQATIYNPLPRTDTVAIIYVMRTQEAHVQRDVVRAYTHMSIEELCSVVGEFFYITMHPQCDEPIIITQRTKGDYIRK